ncbi:MAG: hypothetical protein ACUVRM_11485 [Bacillota bacterium]
MKLGGPARRFATAGPGVYRIPEGILNHGGEPPGWTMDTIISLGGCSEMDKPLKKVSLTLLGLIALILLNAPLISADDTQFVLYQNKEYQIEILYPKSWRIAEETLGAQVIFLSPLESDEDKFSKNLNIIIMKARQIDDLETIS